MEGLDFSALERCLGTLKRAHSCLLQHGPDSDDHDLFRAACVKEFELILEIVVKLLRRVLREYLTSTRELAEMNYKNVFGLAASHGLLSVDEVDRWFLYRDNRNTTAHEYGPLFAEKIVTTLPAFIVDSDSFLVRMRYQG
ncbi:nucleotidyltransferase substrate binding protein [Hymenobacter sedentarius]|uniref:nucleotidyltransferase substrate binding protein n=1 Tax=Hymenobacter sedentarius TaxID=1411621 RepID=UPI0009006C1E|nr:nucleotidyltransferase substrate binding protein [Hymenobacter sedentarius]